MTNFTFNNVEFTANEAGTHFYKIENGKKKRITSEGYEQAMADFEYQSRKEAQAKAEAEKLEQAAKHDVVMEKQENGNYIVKMSGEAKTNPVPRVQALQEVYRLLKIIENTELRIKTIWDGDRYSYIIMRGDKKLSSYWSHEEAQKDLEELLAEEAANKPIPEKGKKAIGGKTMKKSRKKNFALTIEFDGKEYGITEKQVDFMSHLKDTNFWEHGLDSTVWIPMLCDEIGGQFEGKPLSVGAMVSTLREKGLIVVGVDTVTGFGERPRKMKYLSLTDAGKAMTKAVGGLE